jgi:hypothetical protein
MDDLGYQTLPSPLKESGQEVASSLGLARHATATTNPFIVSGRLPGRGRAKRRFPLGVGLDALDPGAG